LETCNIKESEYCSKECKDRICSKVPIIISILTSESQHKIQNLIDVLYKYELKIGDYIK
jgi:hypothetical protein